MSKSKVAMMVIGGIVGLAVLVFAVGLARLAWMRFFNPREENVRREVFEETKSYQHGKTQDLAKYYEEYHKAESAEDKAAIRSVVKMRFAEFDAEKLHSPELRGFLREMRGY